METVDFMIIDGILKNFESISLLNSDTSKFVKNSKFITSYKNFISIIENISWDYNVLRTNDKFIFRFETDYYDNTDFQTSILNYNLNNRIRIRYCSDLENFSTEIKYNSAKNTTIKKNIKVDLNYKTLSEKIQNLFLVNSNQNFSNFELKLKNSFSRITFFNKSFNEKITFDFNLNFENKYGKVTLNDWVIIKTENIIKSNDTDFSKLFCNKIKKYNISKYSTGIFLLNSNIQYNKFEPSIIKFKNINNAELIYFN
jgi:hypothetical protein